MASEWIRGYEIITDDAAQRHVEGRVLPLLSAAWAWREVKRLGKGLVHE